MSFKYCTQKQKQKTKNKKKNRDLAPNKQVMGFLRLLIFLNLRLSTDRIAIKQQSRELDCISLFFILNLSFLSSTWKYIILTQWDLLFVSWFANTTNSNPNSNTAVFVFSANLFGISFFGLCFLVFMNLFSFFFFFFWWNKNIKGWYLWVLVC